ncbi:hypothetical protein DID88_003056 [Monilinia fructigena]|uniref:Uncharacterized protein n=1 Tax=Monilinia fructigena TaxID=38457 RepID=A0A395IEW9_9HELO|nr:hypothetical protein DID88_003056 [Monilinia fructigena]
MITGTSQADCAVLIIAAGLVSSRLVSQGAKLVSTLFCLHPWCQATHRCHQQDGHHQVVRGSLPEIKETSLSRRSVTPKDRSFRSISGFNGDNMIDNPPTAHGTGLGEEAKGEATERPSRGLSMLLTLPQADKLPSPTPRCLQDWWYWQVPVGRVEPVHKAGMVVTFAQLVSPLSQV